MIKQAASSAENIDDGKKQEKIPIRGRFDQYRSSYWSGAIAALGLRYFFKFLDRPHWDNIKDKAKSGNSNALEQNRYSIVSGIGMYIMAAVYAFSTAKDMRSVFSESIAWEFGKNEKDVGIFDFMSSKNTMVQQTVKNYFVYNIKRFAVNSMFFVPYLLHPFCKNQKWFQNLMHQEAGVDIGVSANAAYLFSDIMSRKVTPFEELQSLIDSKINHSDHFADKITTSDLLDIYERHAANDKNKSFMSYRGTPKWVEAVKVFERMADLINQTYKNDIPREKADFGFSKFIYLVGNQLIDPSNIERSLALVEIANARGVKAAENARDEVKKGASVESVMDKVEAISKLNHTEESVIPESMVYRNKIPKSSAISEMGISENFVEAEKARKAHESGFQVSA